MLAGTLIILLIRLLTLLLSGKTIKSGNRTKLLGGNIITLALTFIILWNNSVKRQVKNYVD